MGRIAKIGTAVVVVALIGVAVGVAVSSHKTPPPGPTAQQVAVKTVETYAHTLAYGRGSAFVAKRERDGDWLVGFKTVAVPSSYSSAMAKYCTAQHLTPSDTLAVQLDYAHSQLVSGNGKKLIGKLVTHRRGAPVAIACPAGS